MLKRILLLGMIAGSLYAGGATALRCYEIHHWADDSETLEGYLRPLELPSGETIRTLIERVGWSPDEDIVVIAAASAMSPQDLQPVLYSLGYALYPAHVSAASWCDPAATPRQCEVSAAVAPLAAALGPRRVRRVLVLGDPPPFPSATVHRLSPVMTAVSLW